METITLGSSNQVLIIALMMLILGVCLVIREWRSDWPCWMKILMLCLDFLFVAVMSWTMYTFMHTNVGLVLGGAWYLLVLIRSLT